MKKITIGNYILKEHNTYIKTLNQNIQHQDIFQQDLGH